MKLFTNSLAVAFLFLANARIAPGQDAPSATFRGAEPGLRPTPAEESAQKAITKSDEASAAKKDETLGAKSEKKAASKPGGEGDRSTRKGDVVSTLRQMEREWEASPHDPATIEKMVANDFVGVTSEGKIVTKKVMLKGASPGKEENSASVAHMDVRLPGPKMAIVVGTSKVSGKEKNGQKFRSIYRFTDTWIERDGKWQCIASQATTVPGK